MKRTWTRMMAFLLAVVLLAGLIPPTMAQPRPEASVMSEPEADQTPVIPLTETAEDFAWTLESGILTVTGSGAMPNWTSGGAPWYSRRSEITSAIVEEGLTSVGDYAFASCTALTSVELPETGLTYIGRAAFLSCKIKSVELSEGLLEIGNSAFAGSKLQSVELPESLEKLGGSAFEECMSLVSVKILGSIERINSNTFWCCTNLETIEIAEGPTAISGFAFYTCRRLTSIDIPDTVIEIGEYAFTECTWLETVRFSDSLRYIYNDAFYGCTSLTAVDLPDTMTEIGNCAFMDCTALETVDLPDSLGSLGFDAFNGCSALTSVELPDDQTVINAGSFYGCSSLMSVTFPSALTLIGQNAFVGCSSLTEVDLPYALWYIGYNVFSGCRQLTKAVIREGVTTIESNSFQNCSQLTIYGYTGSYAEEYATARSIPFSPMDSSADRFVTLSLVDEAGSAVDSGYQVKWYADGKLIGRGNTLRTQNTGSTYTCRITLGEALVTVYYQPAEITFTVGDEDVTLECVLKRIPMVTLSGRLVDENGTGIPGTIHITQNYHNALTKTETLTALEDGSFSAQAAAVPTTFLFQAEGFLDQSLPMTLTGLSGGYALGDVTLCTLPDAKVTLELLRQDAARPGETAGQTRLADFEGWTFAVTNVTRGITLTDFSVQYPYLIPGEELAAAGDVLRIGAENLDAGIVCEPVEIQLNDLAAGCCTLTFWQQGSFVLEEIDGAIQSRLMVFDADGALIAADLIHKDYRSADLRPGTYQVVLMEHTELLKSVPELSVLDKYGLTAGEDYTKLDVTIADGVITVMGQVQIPKLDESRLFYTKPEATGITVTPNPTFINRNVLLRIEYELPDDIGASEEMVCIDLPEGLQAMPNSLTVDNQRVSFTETDGRIQVPVGREKAIIRVYVTGGAVGTYEVNTELEFDLDGKAVTQPLGSAEVELDVVFFNLPERTSFSDLIVTGTALPNSTITVYDGDEPLGTATSNGAGTWQANVKLDNPYSYVPHLISIGVSPPQRETEIRSEQELLIYDGSLVEALRVTMCNGTEKTVYDFRDPTADPYYTYTCRDFSFVVELNQDDDSMVEEVYVVTANGAGKTTYVKCFYDATKNVWLGNHEYDGASNAPVGLDVLVVVKDSAPPTLDEEVVDELEKEYQQIVEAVDRELEEQRAEIEREVILPDLKTMTIEEVIAYIDEVQADADALQKDTDDALWGSLEAEGIIVEETDSGTRMSNGSMGLLYREEILDKVDQTELKQKGYTSMPISGKEPVYIHMNGNTIDTVDPNTKTRVTVELEEPTNRVEDIISDAIALQGYKSFAENCKKTFIETVDKPFYLRQWKALTERTEKNKKAMTELEKKILALKQSNVDPDLVQEFEKLYDQQSIKAAIQNGKLEELTAKLRKMGILDSTKTLGLMDMAGVMGSAYSLGKSIDKGTVLKEVYKSLAGSCGSNSEYQSMEIEIRTVNSSMNVASGSSLMIDVVTPLAATAVSPWLGLGAFGAQQFADYKLNKEYNRITSKLKTMDCNGDGNPDYYEELILQLMKELIVDPSGYVYEAVPSNRLEGVKAEVYYLDENGEDVLWNAEHYDQVNPQYTDSEGRYHWDVPFGRWLVKYSKEGYLDTDSSDDPAADEDGYLPVPPPQLEVNVGMISTASPVVENLNVYQDQVQIIFSQYMKPDQISLTVTSGGKTVSGTLEPVNAEYNEEQTEQFATVFNFVPDSELSGTATVTISGAVNYAGTEMAEVHTQTKPVAVRPTAVAMAEEAALVYGETLELEIQILPAAAGANKTLTVTTSAPGLVDVAEQTVVTDENGIAVVTVIGSLPSNAEVTVALDGTDLASTALIHVEAPKEEVCEKVTASIPNGSVVEAGTELELSTATEGAQIYYTLDGTCPCIVDSPSRIRYTGPIVLTEDTFLIAYAVKKGFEDSPTAGFMYTVEQKLVNPFTDVPEGSFYYDPVMWAVANGITNGTSATTFGPNEQCMRAQVVTFLWRAAGAPEPTKTDNPFVDVMETDFYYKAVLWAVEKGVTNGVDVTHFGPFAYCNRAQVVTFLHRSLGSPAVESANNPFADVPEDQWFTAPVLWAVENGVTNGLSATAFGPNAICNRAQIVTFLYRTFAG